MGIMEYDFRVLCESGDIIALCSRHKNGSGDFDEYRYIVLNKGEFYNFSSQKEIDMIKMTDCYTSNSLKAILPNDLLVCKVVYNDPRNRRKIYQVQTKNYMVMYVLVALDLKWFNEYTNYNKAEYDMKVLRDIFNGRKKLITTCKIKGNYVIKYRGEIVYTNKVSVAKIVTDLDEAIRRKDFIKVHTYIDKFEERLKEVKEFRAERDKE